MVSATSHMTICCFKTLTQKACRPGISVVQNSALKIGKSKTLIHKFHSCTYLHYAISVWTSMFGIYCYNCAESWFFRRFDWYPITILIYISTVLCELLACVLFVDFPLVELTFLSSYTKQPQYRRWGGSQGKSQEARREVNYTNITWVRFGSGGGGGIVSKQWRHNVIIVWYNKWSYWQICLWQKESISTG